MELKAYKFRIYPNKQQQELLNKAFGCCRFIFNTLLNERQTYYKQNGNITEYKHTTEKQLKIQFPFLKETDSIALQQSRINLDTAYRNFFKHQNGFVKFKSKYSRQSYKTVSTKDNIKIDFNSHTIKLPKFTPIKFRDQRIFNNKINSVTISKNLTGKYYVSILTEENIKPLPISVNIIGIDLGIKSYITTSGRNKTDNPKILKQYESQLTLQQRKLSNKKKGSNNYNKQKLKVAKIHEKITNVRKDFQHKLSTKIINENQVIKVEDLCIEKMLKTHSLAKSISDCSWAGFIQMLQYKAEWYGRTLIKIDRFFPSSKTCNVCKNINVSLELKDREWTCEKCGAKHDRDINAAINILNYTTVGITGCALRDIKSQ